MRSKIHHAMVTQADLNYEGSISIDEELLKAADILPYEQVDVLNINNGERFTTYAIKAPAGSKEIKINGAAARKAQVKDRVIIISYGIFNKEEVNNYKPKTLILDEKNNIKK